MVRRMSVAWNVRLPKRVARRLRLLGAISRLNGRLRGWVQSEAQVRWWHRNAGRLLSLDAKWFGP